MVQALETEILQLYKFLLHLLYIINADDMGPPSLTETSKRSIKIRARIYNNIHVYSGM